MNTKKNKSKNSKKKTIRNKKVHGGSKEIWDRIYNYLNYPTRCKVKRFCEESNGDMDSMRYRPYIYQPDMNAIEEYRKKIDDEDLKYILKKLDELPDSFINEIDIGNTTLLHLICKKKPAVSRLYTIEIAKKLIKKGADVNLTDKFGCIPLHYAVIIEGNDTCIERQECINYDKFSNLINLLLENGSDPNFKDKQGITPFHSLYIENLGQKDKSSGRGYTTSLTESIYNFKFVYLVAMDLIKYGGDIDEQIPEDYPMIWIDGRYPFAGKSVIDIVQRVKNSSRFNSVHYGWGINNVVENMRKKSNDLESERLELIERRNEIKNEKALRPSTMQISLLETFFKKIKDTPTYKVIINQDITSDVRKEFKNYLDKISKNINNEKIIYSKDENFKNIFEIIPKFIELLEKEKEMEIGLLNQLEASLIGIVGKAPEFKKSEYYYQEDLDNNSAPKPSSKVISDKMDIDRVLDSNLEVQNEETSEYEVAEDKNIFKFGDESLEPPIIPVVNLKAPNVPSKNIKKAK
tara:strand:- start:11287 stop:12846 length:1560 start_codon:yes stop_codon:yes gene_type:complete